MPDVRLLLGDCLERLADLPDESIDACVTDPPYGIGFMGRAWDHAVPSVEVWREVFRVLKPGAHLLAFFGTRTYHRGAVAIEDAGFEIRDQIGWAFGSGFPKSHDVSKAIDKAAGAEREVVGQRVYADGHVQNSTKLSPPIGTFERTQDERLETAPATPEAQQWAGWGTALKPAWEPIAVARKPLIGTVAGNVLEHGTGALNVDGCRVGAWDGASTARKPALVNDTAAGFGQGLAMGGNGSDIGRWPANLIHDGSPDVLRLFPVTGPARAADVSDERRAEFFRAGALASGVVSGRRDPANSHSDPGGSAARFFYCAKADASDREAGLSHMAERTLNRVNAGGLENDPKWAPIQRKNHHPTVKPTDLMRYLCRLITPPGGTVLDPFMGSGSTGRGAMLEGFGFVGIDIDPEYLEIARARIAEANPIDDPPPLTRPGQLSLFAVAEKSG